MLEKPSELTKKADSVGLKINSRKTKIMKINVQKKDKIKINDEELEEVSQFCYLGSTLTVEGDIMKEVNIQIGKAYAAYNKLKNIWIFWFYIDRQDKHLLLLNRGW